MLIKKGSKLFEKGKPTGFGYALSADVDYNLKDGKYCPFRLKEWDFYQIVSRDFSAYFIMGHVGYATSIDITLFEFSSGNRYHVGKLLPFKKVNLEPNADADSVVTYKSKDLSVSFQKLGAERFLNMSATDKTYGNCQAQVKLTQTQPCSVLVLTPFDKPNQFYLNQKIGLMTAQGSLSFGDKVFNFSQGEHFALLDWGRGVLPFSHEWIWGSGNGMLNGKLFGFNLGSFGNNQNGTENIFYYDGKAVKLGNVNINFDKTDVMKPWTFTDRDGLFNLTMTPVFDNYTATKVLWVDNSCHQVFGNFNGYMVVDGNKIDVKDFWAFCENAHNKW